MASPSLELPWIRVSPGSESSDTLTQVSNRGEFRRGHKKSRHGCMTCKQRHMKCDESRPFCSNCRAAERICEYREPQPRRRARKSASSTTVPRPGAETSKEGNGTGASTPLDLPVTHPDLSSGSEPSPVSGASEVGLLPDGARVQTGDGKSGPPPGPAGGHLDAEREHGSEDEADAAINMLHMELLAHFSSSTFGAPLDCDFPDTKAVVVKTAVSSPYLMYAILAISARELAATRPHKREYHMNVAIRLQTRAISLFNADEHNVINTGATGPIILPRVLFSALLGRHLFADALASRTPDLDTFMDGYIHAITIYRSSMNMMADKWQLLLETDVRSAVLWGEAVRLRLEDIKKDLPHMQSVVPELLSSRQLAGHLTTEERDACVYAAEILYHWYEAAKLDREAVPTSHFVLTWTTRVSDLYVDLLARRKPEALAILGWYTVVLHDGRGMWHLADVGSYLMDLVSKHLGPDWDEWLAWPREILTCKDMVLGVPRCC